MGAGGEHIIGLQEVLNEGESGVREFKLNLTVDRVDDKVTGFTVTAEPQGEAEWFCTTFPEGMQQGRAGVQLNSMGLSLFNEKCPFQPAVKLFPASALASDSLTPQDIEQMREHALAGGRFTVEKLSDPLGFRVHHC